MKKKKKEKCARIKKRKNQEFYIQGFKKKKTEIPTSINAIYAGHGEVPNYTRTGQK